MTRAWLREEGHSGHVARVPQGSAGLVPAGSWLRELGAALLRGREQGDQQRGHGAAYGLVLAPSKGRKLVQGSC